MVASGGGFVHQGVRWGDFFFEKEVPPDPFKKTILQKPGALLRQPSNPEFHAIMPLNHINKGKVMVTEPIRLTSLAHSAG
jgi:hypothetical protein